MASISWTFEAENWLKQIHAFIAQNSPKTANKVVNDIYIRAQILAEFPEIGYQYRKESEGEIRILLYGHYRIAYLIKAGEQIDILGVFHGGMEIERYLDFGR